jgi:alpha-L-arabinofuranosidase
MFTSKFLSKMQNLFLISLVYFFLSSCSKNEQIVDNSPTKPTINGEKMSIDASIVNADLSDVKMGYSLNHYQSHSGISRTIPLNTALKNAAVKTLRFPEGELGDSYFWSQPPFDKSNPIASMSGGTVWPFTSTTIYQPDGKLAKSLNYDEFIALCKEIGAEPHIIVGIDAVQKPDGVARYATEEEVIKNAVEWVKYSKQKGYNVKYWEIGNENDLKIAGTNSNQRWTATAYANFVVKLSKLMKAEDPTIKIGANGMTTASWWETLIKTASKDIDFLITHQYSFFGSTTASNAGFTDWYNYYTTNSNFEWVGNVKTLNEAIEMFASDEDKKRLKIAVTEFSAYSPVANNTFYPNNNTLGKAFFTFEMIEKMLKYDRIFNVHNWTTHWFGGATTSPFSLTNAFGTNNEILPTAQVLQIWSENLLNKSISVKHTIKDIIAFACQDPITGRLNVFVLNKSSTKKNIALELLNANLANKSSQKIMEFIGISPEDPLPIYNQKENVKVSEKGIVEVFASGYSLTVFSF